MENRFKNGPSGFKLLVFLFILLFLAGAGLGTGGGFLLGKKQASKNASQNQTQNSSDSKNPQNQIQPTATQEGTEETYTVQPGDTLFTIGLKFSLPWTEIAEYNGLTEDSVIKAGDVLKIPDTKSTTNEMKKFNVDKNEMTRLQAQIDLGNQTWLLDPVAVAKNKVPPTYSLESSDQYTLKSKNEAVGIAIVEVVHETKIYEIKLIQPVKKGSSGIWAVEYLKRI